ncbi:glycosyltransferase family 2 protein [uncultured Pseudoteredinibacter sp.]|uniref:glycosyltransferase family 2 protein n=1 Tax=uncultured Pseudoteredinibacter sp. TaxID=1641701 RepID=UPI00261E7F6A|nr:glycosyltransferase family 2 protein [uncultured Pseudoteredinibacter sp.]
MSTGVDKVSVVIPAKNESVGLAKILPKLVLIEEVFEVIVVDDGSSDNTVELCAEHGVKCISHPESMGNGASIKTGARAAIGDVLVFMDGDGQHQPEEITSLLNKLESGYDLVVGSRDASGQASLGRRLANGFYNWFASWMSSREIHDLTSGFRAVRADKFREFLYMLPNGFSYPTTSTMAFLRSGYSVGFKPINVLQRDGKSHINLVRDGVKFFLIIFKIATLYSPLKLFSLVSFGLLTTGMSYYLYTYFSVGRFTNMGMFLLVSAILVFLMGLLSEQVSTLFYKK